VQQDCSIVTESNIQQDVCSMLKRLDSLSSVFESIDKNITDIEV